MKWLKVQHTEHGYGFFPGGDPRLFHPDSEGQTPEEAENHMAACAAWDRGEVTSEADGKWVGNIHLLRCQFGLGSYEWTKEIWIWDWIRWEWWPRTYTRITWRMSWWWHARKRP